ncbi:hypothetical protein [Phycicoccus sp. Soil748]|uniref:hypothetical protein n=1 Tax=Phycicoccus sp. Soil748 TaxID=1736397 RepID=UPI00070305E2|nr:hypothetical protein [Phycicoccus sp. Soil748]KRE58674.1 hypothetical protein ASG70_18085 [Phycicoccus sp. Soil748]
MATDVLVLPSPLLGPAVYDPLAAALTDRGAPARVAHLPSGRWAPLEVLAPFVEQAREHRPSALLAHSNAGYLVPALRARAPVDVVVFVDAALPLVPGATTLLAPPGFAAFVADLPQEDGVLPPWRAGGTRPTSPVSSPRRTGWHGSPRRRLGWPRRTSPPPSRCRRAGLGSPA